MNLAIQSSLMSRLSIPAHGEHIEPSIHAMKGNRSIFDEIKLSGYFHGT